MPHFVRNEPKLDVAYKGYTFTPEDKKNLLQNGNLGKVVDFPDKNTGELRPHFISIDRLTNEIVDIIAGTFFICDCRKESFGSLSEEQQKRYLEKYRLPERFFRTRDGIEAVSYKPQNRER